MFALDHCQAVSRCFRSCVSSHFMVHQNLSCLLHNSFQHVPFEFLQNYLSCPGDPPIRLPRRAKRRAVRRSAVECMWSGVMPPSRPDGVHTPVASTSRQSTGFHPVATNDDFVAAGGGYHLPAKMRCVTTPDFDSVTSHSFEPETFPSEDSTAGSTTTTSSGSSSSCSSCCNCDECHSCASSSVEEDDDAFSPSMTHCHHSTANPENTHNASCSVPKSNEWLHHYYHICFLVTVPASVQLLCHLPCSHNGCLFSLLSEGSRVYI